MEKDAKNDQLKRYKLLASHIEIFKKAFDVYINYSKLIDENINERESNDIAAIDGDSKILLFDELAFNYYQTVIHALKKITKQDKEYVDVLITTYEELWKTAPKLKDRDYITSYLLDLCKFLYEIEETAKLTFFYNLLIYSRGIPFVSFSEKRENYLIDSYSKKGEDDPFEEFRKDRKERILNNFNERLFEETYKKFFHLLTEWRDKTDGYYTKDEIFFMNGLFILDELTNIADLWENNKDENKNINKDTLDTTPNKSKMCEANSSSDYKTADKEDDETKTPRRFKKQKEGKNIYKQVYDNEMNETISGYNDKALRYFKRAINYNPNNSRYYYEYARCLKNSGKSDEAEKFFKKAFDLKSES